MTKAVPAWIRATGILFASMLLLCRCSDGLQVGRLGDHRFSNVYQLDLQLGKAFRWRSSLTVIPQFACFNLVDSHTVLDRNGFLGVYDAQSTPVFVPDPYFNGVFESMHPRVYRGGVRITF